MALGLGLLLGPRGGGVLMSEVPLHQPLKGWLNWNPAGMAQSSPWPMISIGEANRISLSLTNRAPPARLPLAELQVQGYLAHKKTSCPRTLQ